MVLAYSPYTQADVERSNTMVILDYHWDQLAFQEDVRAHIKKHASKSKEVMRKEILGE